MEGGQVSNALSQARGPGAPLLCSGRVGVGLGPPIWGSSCP